MVLFLMSLSIMARLPLCHPCMTIRVTDDAMHRSEEQQAKIDTFQPCITEQAVELVIITDAVFFVKVSRCLCDHIIRLLS